MFVILAKKIVYDYEEALPFILEGKKVIEIIDDEESWDFIGKEINEKNYDDMVAEFWKDNRKQWVTIFCDAMIFENESVVNVPKGKYEIEMVREIK